MITKLLAGGVVLFSALTSAGCGGDDSRAENEGTLAFSILAAGSAPVATIAIRDVLDPDNTYFVECYGSTSSPAAGTFCDSLLLLPPSLYEVVVVAADSDCQLEQDRFTAVVEAGDTTELSITLVCATDTAPVDAVIDSPPTLEDIAYALPDGTTASNGVCWGGDAVTITITVRDPDVADCTGLSHGWYAGDASGFDWTEPLLGASSVASCRYSATMVPDPQAVPLGEYFVTFWVGDPEGNFTSITLPVNVIDCTAQPGP